MSGHSCLQTGYDLFYKSAMCSEFSGRLVIKHPVVRNPVFTACVNVKLLEFIVSVSVKSPWLDALFARCQFQSNAKLIQCTATALNESYRISFIL